MYDILKECLNHQTIFKNLRPFSNSTYIEILDASLQSFDNPIFDLELATLGLLELQERFQNNQKTKLKNAILQITSVFKENNHIPIPWLNNARSTISKLKNLGDIGKGKHNTYVILIDGFSPQKGRYGVYVGETSKSTEERFIEHQNGIRSGRGTKERSIQLMKTLMPFYQFKRQNKDFYETYLHHSLAKTVVKEPYYLSVKGNTNLKTSELPKKFQSNLTGLK